MSDTLFIECKICFKRVKNLAGLGSHITRCHNTTKSDYKNSIKILKAVDMLPIFYYIKEKYGKNYLKQFKICQHISQQ
jgi:hypothetical protein